ncbi:MAG: methyltransferase [Planctomycetota bacterium]|jgi:protein-S-isoprenylcysteine O-methyltransferase Ste14
MTDENRCRWILVAIMGVGVAMSIWYRSRADRARGRVRRREDNTLFLVAQGVFGVGAVGGLLVYLINPAWMHWSQLDLPVWLRLIGAPLGLVGLALFHWVFRNLGENVTPTAQTRKQHNLVTSGPYRWVRHPMYSSGLVLFASYFLLSANWFAAIMCGMAFVMLVIRLPAEEANLIERFGGEYRAYMQGTGRFLPRLHRQNGS